MLLGFCELDLVKSDSIEMYEVSETLKNTSDPKYVNITNMIFVTISTNQNSKHNNTSPHDRKQSQIVCEGPGQFILTSPGGKPH